MRAEYQCWADQAIGFEIMFFEKVLFANGQEFQRCES